MWIKSRCATNILPANIMLFRAKIGLIQLEFDMRWVSFNKLDSLELTTLIKTNLLINVNNKLCLHIYGKSIAWLWQ